MNLSLCTISFRHHLTSIEQIAKWASGAGFEGIELWGPHAKNMSEQSELGADWLKSYGLSVSMVSDYLPLDGDLRDAVEKAKVLSALCVRWGAAKLRTFAGNQGSAEVGAEQRKDLVLRLRTLCEVVSEQGLALVVETHPGTLADTLGSTARLLEEVRHDALRVNFDVIHVWEAGADPVAAYRSLHPFISHLHLKNVTSRDRLHIFAPGNVYAPAGDRRGMINLFDGACDFQKFFSALKDEKELSLDRLDASLEWFGADVYSTLTTDREELRTRGVVRSRNAASFLRRTAS